jgi:putative transposase
LGLGCPRGGPRDASETVHGRAGHRDLERGGGGGKTTELCRRHGISEQTFYRWKAKYGGLEVNEARRLRQLEHENSRLKRLVADLTLDNQALKELVGKKA